MLDMSLGHICCLLVIKVGKNLLYAPVVPGAAVVPADAASVHFTLHTAPEELFFLSEVNFTVMSPVEDTLGFLVLQYLIWCVWLEQMPTFDKKYWRFWFSIGSDRQFVALFTLFLVLVVGVELSADEGHLGAGVPHLIVSGALGVSLVLFPFLGLEAVGISIF